MKPSVAPNIIDRAISFVAPRTAARRMYAREIMAMYGSYTGARMDRRETAGWLPFSGSADADSLYDLRILRSRSRDLVRNAPLAAGAIGTVVENVAGTGLSLQPTPDLDALGWTADQGEEFVRKVESEFGLWAESKDCDVTRTQNFYELQGLTLRSALESGDTITLLPFVKRNGTLNPYQTTLQIVEADRLANPKGSMDGQRMASGNRVYGGVEVDEAGAPMGYNILKRHPGAVVLSEDPLAVDRVVPFSSNGRPNVVHLFDRIRPDQKRGIPYLAPVIERLKQLDKYTEAEIQRAVISSLFTVFVKTEIGEDIAGLGVDAKEVAAAEKNYALGSGAIVGLAQGQDVQFADPKSPNSQFDPFVLAMLRQIGVALGLPFEILVKHFTASYSAARAALLEAWKFYRNRRSWLSQNWCQPVFEAWMYEAVAMGRINAPGFFTDPVLHRAYLKCEWVGDAPGAIDPQKEVEAAIAAVDANLSDLKTETMKLFGRNWDDVLKQRAKEKSALDEAGLSEVVPQVAGPGQPGKPGKPPVPPQNKGDEETPEDQQ